MVGEYDATTGAPINANLITELGGGPSNPLAAPCVIRPNHLALILSFNPQ